YRPLDASVPARRQDALDRPPCSARGAHVIRFLGHLRHQSPFDQFDGVIFTDGPVLDHSLVLIDRDGRGFRACRRHVMLSAGSPLLACPRSNLRFNGAKVHVSSVIGPQLYVGNVGATGNVGVTQVSRNVGATQVSRVLESGWPSPLPRGGTTVPHRCDAAVTYGLDEQVRSSQHWRVVPFTVKMTRLKSPIPEGMSMVKAVVSRGEIRPLEPLPADWQEGQPLRVEKADGDETPVEEIDRDFAVLASLCAASEPANEDQLERALREARRQAKEQVRRQMGLA